MRDPLRAALPVGASFDAATGSPGAPLASTPLWATLALGCLGLMLCLPFLAPFKAPPVPSFHAEILAAALGLLAISATALLRRGAALPLPLPLTLLLPGTLCLILLAQVLTRFAPAQQPALLALLYLLWAAALMVTGAALRDVLGLERTVTVLAACVLAGGVLSALAGVMQLLKVGLASRWVMPSSDSVWGNLGQRNHFAAYLAMAMASGVYLWSSGRLRTLPAVLMGVLLCWLLPLSASRSVWLYAGAFLVLALLWRWRERSPAHGRLALAAAGAVLIMGLAEWTWSVLDLEGLGQVTSLDRLRDNAPGERRHIWQVAWGVFGEHLWTGVGYGQFAWHYFLANGSYAHPVDGYAHHAHNLFLHLGAELGMAGPVALLLGAGTWWLAARRLVCTPAAWWVLCLCAVAGIHAMLEYPLWYAYFLGPVALMLGLCGGPRLEFRPSRLLGGLLVLCLALSWFVTAQLFRDYVYLENFLAFRYRYIDATAEVSERAKQMLLDIRKTSLLAPYVELGLARAIEVDRTQLDAKLRVNGHAMRMFPIDDVVYRQAMLLALKGEVVPALRQWDLARASYPGLEPMALAVLRRRAEDLGAGLIPLRQHVEAITRR